MSQIQRAGPLVGVPRSKFRGVWTAIAVATAFVSQAYQSSDALAQDAAVKPPLTTIAVGISEPGHLDLITRLVKRYNTRDGVGGIGERHSVAIIPVDDMSTAMTAVDGGQADMALATVELFDEEYDLADGWVRPIAVEVLTIATRRARLVRDPRQLRGLDVEIPAERADRVVERMNQVLSRFGISMPSGSYTSAGDPLSRRSDPFLRLCQSDYDVRVDMVIHPFPAFAGALPCELRLMSFPTMPPQTDAGPGVRRYEVDSETYGWLNQDITSLGSAVALVQPDPTATDNAGRDQFVDYLGSLVGREPGLLSKFEGDLWLGLDIGAATEEVSPGDETQESIE